MIHLQIYYKFTSILILISCSQHWHMVPRICTLAHFALLHLDTIILDTHTAFQTNIWASCDLNPGSTFLAMCTERSGSLGTMSIQEIPQSLSAVGDAQKEARLCNNCDRIRQQGQSSLIFVCNHT